MNVEPDKNGLYAAQQVAGWRIGDRYWADIIIDAYLNPEKALEALRIERGED